MQTQLSFSQRLVLLKCAAINIPKLEDRTLGWQL